MAKFKSVLSNSKVELEPLYFKSDSGTHGLKNHIPEFDSKGFVKDSGVNIKNIIPPVNNFSASSPPSISDDSDSGYSVGSIWVYNNDIYTLTDDTPGSANWVKDNQGLFDYKLWVSPDGDDTTAEIGNEAKPFATIQGAINQSTNHPDFNTRFFLVYITPGYYIENIVLEEKVVLFFEKGAELEVNPSSVSGGIQTNATKNIIKGYGNFYNNTSYPTFNINTTEIDFNLSYLELNGDNNNEFIIGSSENDQITINKVILKSTTTGNSSVFRAKNMNFNQIKRSNTVTGSFFRFELDSGVSSENSTLNINYAENNADGNFIEINDINYINIDSVISNSSTNDFIIDIKQSKDLNYVLYNFNYITGNGSEKGLNINDLSDNSIDIYNQSYASHILNINYIDTPDMNILMSFINNSKKIRVNGKQFISEERNLAISKNKLQGYVDRHFIEVHIERAITNTFNGNIFLGGDNESWWNLKIKGDYINTNTGDCYNIDTSFIDVGYWQEGNNYNINDLVLFDASTSGGQLDVETFYYECIDENGAGTNAPTGFETDNQWWEWQPTSPLEFNFMGNTKFITNKNASNKGWVSTKVPVNFRSMANIMSNHSLFDLSGSGKGKLQKILKITQKIKIEKNIIS